VRKKILTVTLTLGVLLFCFLIYKAGPAQILDGIKALSWKSFLILMPLRLKAVFDSSNETGTRSGRSTAIYPLFIESTGQKSL